MTRQFVHVIVEDGVMRVSGNVDVPGRVFLLESAVHLLIAETMKPVRPEGRPNDPPIPGTPSVGRMPTFEGRTVA